MEYYINPMNENEVGVLLTHNFGAGWSSWSGDYGLAYDKRVIDFWIRNHDVKNIGDNEQLRHEWEDIFAKWGYYHPCFYGFDSLKLDFVPKGKKFRINEYDGLEQIVYYKDEDWIEFE